MLDDADAAIAEAQAAGVESIVAIGIDVTTSRLAIGFAKRLARVCATVGLHPHYAAACGAAVLADLEILARQPEVVAIGECGLDFYRELASRGAQRRAFSSQIELARRVRLPLVVHVREAGDEALAMLAQEATGLTVIMHCFSLPEHVDQCNDRGYYASFAGNVTYKNAGDLRAAAARIREDRLLVETDAPFLTPVPHRGAVNSPARVVDTAAVVADCRGWTTERVAEVTTANARRVFGLPEGS